MNITALIEKMVIIFVTIGFGFLAGKMDIIDKPMAQKLSKLVVWITNPLLNLNSVLAHEHLLSNREVLILTAIALCGYAFLVISSRFIPLILGVDKNDIKERGIYEFMYIFSNIGYMGYPVISALYGPGAIFYATIFVIPFNVICFTYGAYIVSGRESAGRFQLKSLLQPVVLSAIISYALYLLNVRVPVLMTDCFAMVGDLTTPLAMLILGSSLAGLRARDIFGTPRLYGLAAFKLIVLPLISYFLVGLFIESELLKGITVVIMAMPAAINATMVSYEYGGNCDTAASGVFLTTLLSIITIPLMLWLLFGV